MKFRSVMLLRTYSSVITHGSVPYFLLFGNIWDNWNAKNKPLFSYGYWMSKFTAKRNSKLFKETVKVNGDKQARTRVNPLAIAAKSGEVLHASVVTFKGSMNKSLTRYFVVRKDFCLYSYQNEDVSIFAHSDLTFSAFVYLWHLFLDVLYALL